MTIPGSILGIFPEHCAMENLRVPLDRARRVALRTGMEQLEHVPERERLEK